MSCQTCGREAEGDHQGHWLGCEEAVKQWADEVTEKQGPVPLKGDLKSDALCEHEGCSEPKASKGPRAKWCEAHKDPKNREN